MQAGSYDDAVSQKVVALDHDVANVDADAEDDPTLGQQRIQRSLFVDLDKAGIADDIGDQDGGEAGRISQSKQILG